METPGCWRVYVKGADGAVAGPIIEASSEGEAKMKATVIFGDKVVSATWMHGPGGRGAGHNRGARQRKPPAAQDVVRFKRR